MKIKFITALFILVVFVGSGVLLKTAYKFSPPSSITNKAVYFKLSGVASIREFMGDPSLEITFVKEDVPMPYFRVGKVTKTKDGENLEPTEGWLRKVNV